MHGRREMSRANVTTEKRVKTAHVQISRAESRDVRMSKCFVRVCQARSHDWQNEEVDRSSAPPLPSVPSLRFPPLLLEVGPLNLARGSVIIVSNRKEEKLSEIMSETERERATRNVTCERDRH